CWQPGTGWVPQAWSTQVLAVQASPSSGQSEGASQCWQLGTGSVPQRSSTQVAVVQASPSSGQSAGAVQLVQSGIRSCIQPFAPSQVSMVQGSWSSHEAAPSSST